MVSWLVFTCSILNVPFPQSSPSNGAMVMMDVVISSARVASTAVSRSKQVSSSTSAPFAS